MKIKISKKELGLLTANPKIKVKPKINSEEFTKVVLKFINEHSE